jgi:uncharacterized alpha-E superfamily protein
MYWFGRLNERAENTARLVSVNANLLLDLPKMVKHIWADLINITGGSEFFYKKFTRPDERNVVKFILADETNPASLVCSVKAARENARTTREIIPAEAWEKINEFHLYVRKNVEKALKREGRHKFLNDVIMYCQQMTGLLFGNMSHGNAYNFIHIGMNLERADMTTRIVDVGCMNLVQEQAEIPDSYDNILWMNVLRSLSAYQMHRQNVLDRITGKDVVEFLLKDPEFPRSVGHCMAELEWCFSKLPHNDLPLRSITHIYRIINDTDLNKLMVTNRLHSFIDEIQIDLGDIHNQVSQTWFGYTGEQQEQTGTVDAIAVSRPR